MLLLATRGLAGTPVVALVRSGVASALAEETLYRGYLFRQLYRCAGWPFALAVLVNALPFAIGHLYQAEGRGVAVFLQVMIYMSLVAALAAWIFTRWNDNTWLLIGIHGFANVWWQLLVGSDTSRLYGWLQWAVLGVLLLPLVGLTLLRHRLPLLRPSANSSVSADSRRAV